MQIVFFYAIIIVGDNMKKIYLLLFLLLVFPIKTNAIYDVIDSRCTNQSKLSLRKDASNISYRLTKVENKDNVMYTVLFYNLTDDLYIADSNNVKYEGTKIENIKPGTSMIVNIYVSDNNYCGGYKAGSRIIKVPYYNKYSENELCNGYEDYFLCKEDSNVNMSEKEFKAKMDSYIKSLKEEREEVKEVEKEINDSFDFMEFLNNYWIYIASGVGFILIAAAIVIIINKRKNRGIL